VDQAESLAASVQDDDPRSTLTLYRRLIGLRAATPALRRGGQRMLDAGPDVLAYRREAAGETWLVALNFASRTRRPDLSALGTADGTLVVSTDPDRAGGPLAPHGLALRPDEGVVLRLGAGASGFAGQGSEPARR
jgi:hypothetical protein